jgi:hypothetical protein
MTRNRLLKFMSKKACWIVLLIACGSLVAQEVRQGPLAGLPGEHGIYYKTGSGWVPLPSSIMMPFSSAGAKDFFGVGGRDAVAELPGAHATVRIANTRPTFYVEGISPGSRLYLVRSTEKDDYRQIKMSESFGFPNTPKFHQHDLVEVEVQPMSSDVVSVRPHSDLKPGEYVLVSVIDANLRWIRMGYGFGVTTGTPGP